MKKTLFAGLIIACLSGASARAEEPVVSLDQGYPGTSCDSLCDAMFDACDCGPLWTVRASALFLDREAPDSRVLISNTATGATLLDADDFNFGSATGLDISTLYHRDRCSAYEFRYMWTGDHDASQQYQLAAPTNVTIHTDPTTAFGGNDETNATLSSELHSFELNGRQSYPNLTLIHGFRYVRTEDESLSALLSFPGGGEAASWDADNDLFGYQIGAERSAYFNKLTLTANGKAGIYYNDMDTSFRLDRGLDGTVDAFSNDSHDDVAFVGEIAVTGSYPLLSNLAIRGGYHLLWLEGVAVGVEQVAATESFNAVGEIGSEIETGGIFYHGASAGLEYTY